MNRNHLDEALARMRNADPSQDEVERASARVLLNLGAEFSKVVALPGLPLLPSFNAGRIQNCEDFRSLIPAYLSSGLAAPRKLLLEDHTHECVPCRKAVELARRTGDSRVQPSAHRPSREVSQRNRRLVLRVGLGLAAAAILGVAMQTNLVRDMLWPIDVHATAQTVEGGLYGVWGQGAHALTAGERIERNQAVRTGTGSGAVLELADGSRIEMSARSELSLDRARDGVKIRLERGNVIVTAAKQRDGHLYVETKDCTVSVVGTVFSVASGAKGSRVSVIEGQVNVLQGQSTQALLPGQQALTSPTMEAIPLQQEIAWSRNVEAHMALLREFSAFSQDLAHRIENTEMRYTSNLIPLVPENTLLLASLPNVTQSFADSYALFRKRIDENPELKDWWLSNSAGAAGGFGLDALIGRLSRAGAYLGSEIVIALPKDLAGDRPVVLADVASASGLAAALQDLPSTGLTISIEQGLMVISSDAKQVQRVLAFRRQPGLNPFSKTPLYARVAQAYREGVGWLLAADLQRLVDPAEPQSQQTGLADVQQLVIEQKTGPGGATYRAALGFNQTRQGMAAWLADPAPMGAMEFVSPDAYGVAAVMTKDPALIFDDVFRLIQNEPKALQGLRDYERENRLDLRNDLAASLGNEFLVAIDGPILPTPSWRLVIEVNNAARLQNAFEWSVSNMNREAAIRHEAPITLASETVGGRTFYSVLSPRVPTAIHYTFWTGYLIVAPSRTLLMEAIQHHDSGNTLARSAAFRSQLPADGHDYASGFVYQNVRNLANSLPAGLPVPQLDALKQGVVNSLPTLICLYGEPTRIVMSSKGVLGMNIASIGALNGMVEAAGLISPMRR